MEAKYKTFSVVKSLNSDVVRVDLPNTFRSYHSGRGVSKTKLSRTHRVLNVEIVRGSPSTPTVEGSGVKLLTTTFGSSDLNKRLHGFLLVRC